MQRTITILNRELASYFATPLAYVFIIVFLVLAGVLTFFVGDFFERGQADLQSFFAFHPWLYLVLIPALSMRSCQTCTTLIGVYDEMRPRLLEHYATNAQLNRCSNR